MVSGNLKVEFKNLATSPSFYPLLSDWILGSETHFLEFEAHRMSFKQVLIT